MYYFVKLSSGWYGKECEDMSEASYHVEEHVNSGEIVVMCDDPEAFAELVGIEEDDIIWV